MTMNKANSNGENQMTWYFQINILQDICGM